MRRVIVETQLDPPRPPPERNLLAAMIERAISDIVLARSDSKNRKGAAIRWVWSDDKDEFSFIWVCEELGLRPKLLRKKIIEFEKGLAIYNRERLRGGKR